MLPAVDKENRGFVELNYYDLDKLCKTNNDLGWKLWNRLSKIWILINSWKKVVFKEK